jgi:hypothetical protein
MILLFYYDLVVYRSEVLISGRSDCVVLVQCIVMRGEEGKYMKRELCELFKLFLRDLWVLNAMVLGRGMKEEDRGEEYL